MKLSTDPFGDLKNERLLAVEPRRSKASLRLQYCFDMGFSREILGGFKFFNGSMGLTVESTEIHSVVT